MRIYVGNLSYSSTEESVGTAFEEFGAVDEVSLITDRDTGRSRGFGFVTMPDDDAARTAIEEMNGTDLEGRTLTVNEARPRAQRRGGRGGQGRRRSGY